MSNVPRAIFVVQDVENPIRNFEIDLALKYADDEYTEELSVDVLRPLFNTVQALRVPGSVLPLLVKEVVRKNVLESRNICIAYEAAIMKVYNHRKLVKQAADEEKAALGLPVTPALKQTQYPVDFIEGHQRILC